MSYPFSKEIPNLLQVHFEQLHSESGIPVEIIRERRYESFLGKRPLEQAGFAKSQRRAPGILIPQFGPDGSPIEPIFKPDNPRMDAKGRGIKYETPAKSGVRIGTHPRCVSCLGNPSESLFVTEGVKKLDSLVGQGVCSIGLNGVWGFKGKNEYGTSTILSDWDYIALKDRDVYVVYDSDIITKPQVKQALERLAGFLKQKGAKVHVVHLPNSDEGKDGVDDYLAKGHTIDDVVALATDTIPDIDDDHAPLDNTQYGIHEGQFFVMQNKGGTKVKRPLCNFNASIVDEVIIDDGIDENRRYGIEGTLANGRSLARVEVSAAEFSGLNWTHKAWGAGAVIYAGSTTKDHIRTIMQLSRNGSAPHRIYAHTGWRLIDDERVFLTPNGAIGMDNVRIDLGALGLEQYSLPLDVSEVPMKDAVRNSVDFLDIGKGEVTYPLWGHMYLAPIMEILNPAFVQWLLGHTGSLKSVVCAQALCHYGDFNYLTLPLNWEGTPKGIMKVLSTLKDIPAVIDDWAPGATLSQQRDLEAKAESVIRSVGNNANRAKLRSDGSLMRAYRPRGAVLSTGEQLPGGESRNSRLFVVDIRQGDIFVEALTCAQNERLSYRYAMSNYISWIARNWSYIAATLPDKWKEWRDATMSQGFHLRLPAVVASLYAAIDLGLTFAEESGAVSPEEATERRGIGWMSLLSLASRHAVTVNDQRPSVRFLEALRTLLSQDRLVFIGKQYLSPADVPIEFKHPKSFAGWQDDGFYYLIPNAVYSCVYEFCNRGGEPLTVKPKAVWADLAQMGYTRPRNMDRHQTNIRVGEGREDSQNKWVVPLRKDVVLEER